MLEVDRLAGLRGGAEADVLVRLGDRDGKARALGLDGEVVGQAATRLTRTAMNAESTIAGMPAMRNAGRQPRV